MLGGRPGPRSIADRGHEGAIEHACVWRRRVADRVRQAAALASGEDDVTAVLPSDRPGDGEPEPNAARIGIARTVDAIERLEEFSRSLRGMPGPRSSTATTILPASVVRVTSAPPP